MRAAPSLDAEQTSELLFGEGFALLDLTGGWAWGYSLADHYVGYLAANALGAPIAPTHRVHAAEAVLHSAPDAASGGSAILPRGALVMGSGSGFNRWRGGDGAMGSACRGHCAPCSRDSSSCCSVSGMPRGRKPATSSAATFT